MFDPVASISVSVTVKKNSMSISMSKDLHFTPVNRTMLYTWLDSDDHPRTELNRPLYVVRVVNVHAEIMAHMVWTELPSHLQFNSVKNCSTAAT